MTKLTKPVKRVSTAMVREAGRKREVIVTLEPPCVLGFRAKGCRRTYRLTADVCYYIAVKAEERSNQRKDNRKF